MAQAWSLCNVYIKQICETCVLSELKNTKNFNKSETLCLKQTD